VLCSEEGAVCSKAGRNTKRVTNPRGQNVKIFNIKPCGIYSNHWELGGSRFQSKHNKYIA
jgi:hypothetical protein